MVKKRLWTLGLPALGFLWGISSIWLMGAAFWNGWQFEWYIYCTIFLPGLIGVMTFFFLRGLGESFFIFDLIVGVLVSGILGMLILYTINLFLNGAKVEIHKK